VSDRRTSLAIFAIYALCAWIVHASGFDLTRTLLGGGDGLQAGLASKLHAAKLMPWNPHVQLGQYVHANTQYQSFYPPGLILLAVFPNTFGYNLFILTHYALAGIFCYAFCRELKQSTGAAFLSGLFFMNGGFLTAHKGHQAMLSTAIWLPLLLLFVSRHSRTGNYRDAVAAGGALALSVLAGFPQITLYGLITAVAFWFFRGGAGAIRGVAVCAVAGLLLSSLQLFAVVEVFPKITRQSITLEMFNQNALSIPHFASMLVPNFWGGLFRVPSFGPGGELVEVYGYTGLVPLVLALSIWRRAEPRFWFLVMGVSALLALGLPPIQQFLHHVPVYNLFRAPARHMYQLHFALAVVAGYAWDYRARLRLPLLAVCIAAVLVYFVARELPAYENPNVSLADAKAFQLQALDPSGVSMLHVYGAVLATALVLLGIQRVWLVAIVFLLDTGIPHRTVYENPDTTDLYGNSRRAETKFLLEHGFDADRDRLLPLDMMLQKTYPLLNMMYGLPVANDYTPVWMKRYQRIMGFELNGEGGVALLPYPKVLSTYGVRYLIARSTESIFKVRRTRHYLDLAESPDGAVVFLNPGAAPRFRFARRILPVSGLEDARRILYHDASFDPATDAIVENWTGPAELSMGRILERHAGDSSQRFRVETEGSAFFVASDTWFDGWTATIDGVQAPVWIVNGCVRGVHVEKAGLHEIVFSFRPRALIPGAATTMAGILVVAIAWYPRRARKPGL
jgi:hypothetical protein